ncbi:MAG: polymer-forming cytoskeletal protein [Myxococcales bacterium]|nr:polymer-forming cytoskeletal protein [Myxococcales bacterium]
MAKTTFVLPAGLSLDLSGDQLDLRYDGDVELESTLGRAIATVEAGGNLTVRLDGPVTGDLRAGGALHVDGEVDAGHLHGSEVVLGKHTIKCRAISATHKITIGPANITAEVIIAPEVVIDPKAQGRVTVIESRNERGATKIKGGFALADYEDMFGNSAEFLAQRGLSPLGEEGPAPAPAPAATKPARATKTREPEAPAAPPAPAPAEEEDTDDPLSLSFDDLEPLVDPGNAQQATPSSNQDDLHQRLSEALGRILACYEGTDVPPAIDELRDLVSQRDYDALRQNITEVWNGLLGFHQKRGIRPHHQVTHAFNVIHGLVQ